MADVIRTIQVDMDAEGNIDIRPTFLNVQNGPNTLLIKWEATGLASFPDNDFFAWKEGTGQPAVTWVDEQHLEAAPYVNDAGTRRLWRYWINVAGTKVDPEVNNQPPDGGGMPDDKDKDKDKDTDRDQAGRDRADQGPGQSR